MAVSYLTSDTLIESVKRRSAIPESQVTFEDDDILAFANEEMQIGLVPCVLKMHEEFLVYTDTQTLVPNISSYDIPERAIGSRLRSLFYEDNGTNLREMARINPDDLVFYQNISSINYPKVFYLENNSVILVPQISASPTGTLVMKYFMRPNQLVDEDRVATIISIDTTTGVIQVTFVPTIFSTMTPCDMLQTVGGHKTRTINKVPTSINTITNTITFTPSDLPTGLSVGDIIALAGETIIPQMPDELHPVLAQRTACRCLAAQKDLEGLAEANAKLQEMEVNLGILVDNRTEGQPMKVNNLRGSLRRGKFKGRSGNY